MDIFGYDSPMGLIYIALSSVYEYHDDFTFNENDKTYHYTGQLWEGFSVDTQMKFNSNKKLEHAFCSLNFSFDSYPAIAQTEFNLDYSKKQITFPEGFHERAKRHTIEMTNDSVSFDTTIQKSEPESLVLNISPSVDGLNSIAAYDKDGNLVDMFDVDTFYAYKDNSILIQDVGYKYENMKIVFTEPLTKNNKLSLCFDQNRNDQTYTFKLEQ